LSGGREGEESRRAVEQGKRKAEIRGHKLGISYQGPVARREGKREKGKCEITV